MVVLHRIGAFQTDDVGVEVHDLGFGQSVDQELDGHGQTSVRTVNVRRDRVELFSEVGGVPVVSEHVVGHFERGVRGQSNVVVERAVRVFLRQEIRTVTRTGEALGTGEDLAVLPKAPAHVVAGGAVVVELVTFGHDGVPVGLRHAERGVQDLNGKAQFSLLAVDDSGLVAVFCAVVDVNQCCVLGVAEVVLQHRIKWRGKGGVVAMAGRIRAVTFTKLPEPHGGQIGFAAGQQHVPSGRNARLEVVRDGGVVTRGQGLEAVVPP